MMREILFDKAARTPRGDRGFAADRRRWRRGCAARTRWLPLTRRTPPWLRRGACWIVVWTAPTHGPAALTRARAMTSWWASPECSVTCQCPVIRAGLLDATLRQDLSTLVGRGSRIEDDEAGVIHPAVPVGKAGCEFGRAGDCRPRRAASRWRGRPEWHGGDRDDRRGTSRRGSSMAAAAPAHAVERSARATRYAGPSCSSTSRSASASRTSRNS